MSIEKRLAASLKHDTINGDAQERTIFAGQVREAVTEIVRLRAEARLLGYVIRDVIAHCEDTIRQAGAVRPGLASGNAHKVLQIAKGERDAN